VSDRIVRIVRETVRVIGLDRTGRELGGHELRSYLHNAGSRTRAG
jgi:hypothetical protein